MKSIWNTCRGSTKSNQTQNRLPCISPLPHTHTHTHTQHWSGVILPSRPEEPWPIGRSFHTACSLVDPATVASPECERCPSERHEWLQCPPPDLSPSENCWHGDPKMLVLWGMDNNADPISDAWELNVRTLSWKQVCP